MGIEGKLEDERSVEEQQSTHKFVYALSERNCARFGIEAVQRTAYKQKTIADLDFVKIYAPMRILQQQHAEKYLRRMTFEDNSFVYYSDSGESQSTLFKYAVVAIPGIPSFTYEWQKLESKVRCRWINFIVPGFDLYDERRGVRQYPDQFAFQCAFQLLRLLDSLHIDKFVIIAHSFGLLMLIAALKFIGTKRIAAVGLFGTYGIVPHLGATHILKIFRNTYNGFLKQPDSNSDKLLNSDKDEVRQSILEGISGALPGPISHEISSWVKLNCGSQFNFEYSLQFQQQDMIPYLKFIASGARDAFVESFILERTIEHHTLNAKFEQRLQKFQLDYLHKRFAWVKKLDINYDNLQENFAFMFQDAGHSIHLQKGTQLILPFETFLAVVEALHFEEITPRL